MYLCVSSKRRRLIMLNLFRKPTASPATDIVAQVAAGAVTLVDIREPSEIRASGMAAGAIAIPLALLRLKADPSSPDHDARLSPDAPVALYCASGARSAMASQTLRQLGYRDVTNLGGFSDWQRAGGAVTR
jgi:rhodanese-related sulfurtransferase